MSEFLDAVEVAFDQDPDIDEIGFPMGEEIPVSIVVLQDHKLGIPFIITANLYKYCHEQFMAARKLRPCLHDQQPSNVKEVNVSMLKRTSRVLCLINGFCYTAWNERKRLMIGGHLEVDSELRFAALALRRHPKSDCIWSHRRWLLRSLNTHANDSMISTELNICNEISQKHPKNYQAWAHRQWIFPNRSQAEQRSRILKTDSKETLMWIKSNVSDCSAHHHILHLILQEGVGGRIHTKTYEECMRLVVMYPSQEAVWYLLRKLIFLKKLTEPQRDFDLSLTTTTTTLTTTTPTATTTTTPTTTTTSPTPLLATTIPLRVSTTTQPLSIPAPSLTSSSSSSTPTPTPTQTTKPLPTPTTTSTLPTTTTAPMVTDTNTSTNATTNISTPQQTSQEYVANSESKHFQAAAELWIQVALTHCTMCESPARVIQTLYSAGSGNALQACVASLMGFGLDHCPNFVSVPQGYEAGIHEFMMRYNLDTHKISLAHMCARDTSVLLSVKGRLGILRGTSPRGEHGHVVVARANYDVCVTLDCFEMVMDPHPDSTFLADELPAGAWFMVFEERKKPTTANETTHQPQSTTVSEARRPYTHAASIAAKVCPWNRVYAHLAQI